MVALRDLVRPVGALRVEDVHQTHGYALTARAVVVAVHDHARREQQAKVQLLVVRKVHVVALAKVSDDAQLVALRVVPIESHALEFAEQVHGADVDVGRLKVAAVVFGLVLVVWHIQEGRLRRCHFACCCLCRRRMLQPGGRADRSVLVYFFRGM